MVGRAECGHWLGDHLHDVKELAEKAVEPASSDASRDDADGAVAERHSDRGAAQDGGSIARRSDMHLHVDRSGKKVLFETELLGLEEGSRSEE